MLEPRNIAEKNFNNETNRIVGEIQLHRFGLFLEKYNNFINEFKKKLQNNSHYVRYKPITIQTKAHEDAMLLDLVHSDNKLLSRIFVSLASVCHEIYLLVSEVKDKFCSIFLFYGEDARRKTENLQKISELIGVLENVCFFVNRSHQVIILLLRQIWAILGKGFYTGSASCFPEPLECLAELLVCLVILDNVLLKGAVKEHWSFYKRAVHTMMCNSSQFEISVDNLRSLYKRLVDIDNELLNGKILHNILQKCQEENLIPVIKNSSLSSEFCLFMQQLLVELEKDEENISFTQILLQVNVLFVFHYHLFGTLDKKLFKRLLDVNKKSSACTLLGNILWYPEEFLLKHVPIISKSVDKKIWANNRLLQLSIRSQNLTKESHSFCLQACHWMIEIQKLTRKDSKKFKGEQLHDSCNLLIDGIKLLKKIGELVKWITNLHANEGQPMTKSVLLALCRLTEILKGFQFIFKDNLIPLVYIMLLNSQHLTHKAHSLLVQIKKNSTQEKSYKEKHLDVLSALAIAENSLKGPNTTERLLVTKLALSASGLNHNNLLEVRSVINRLELICNIYILLSNLCNCSFLYWHQSILPIYLGKLSDPKFDLSRYYLILAAVGDCAEVAGGNRVIKDTEDCLNKSLVTLLNQNIETNLRLQTHLHLQLPSMDPFQNTLPRNFRKLIPAQLGNDYIHVKQDVEHYLSTIFYNLTTVILHNCRTYGEMRRLALLQYGLTTVEDSLPMQTLEQGLDVLEITRNINVFVSKYLYNLNNQVFIEEWSNNKHLNTINISHVANSIRTHGIGIMSTTVNYTYQFLKNKFYTFSQFMFDEQIKSRLLKMLRFFVDHKEELNQMYPYERAEKFNFGIRKLGLDSNGLSYLDLFRKLITQIGNAMGYIRLIKSGGRRCLADATCFIRDFKNIDELTDLLDKQTVPELTQKAASCLKRDTKNLVSNFEEATEYFKLLVNVFALEFKDAKYTHLKNFYVIVPPLTINFIEHSLTCKDRLNKKNRDGAACTDDGFAMGLAYIIELLEQTSQLNSLHWFQSVKLKHNIDRKNLENQKASSNRDDQKLQQALSLTEKRINSFDREFQLFYYNFNSAKIFFQT